jgi:hypothetical protein
MRPVIGLTLIGLLFTAPAAADPVLIEDWTGQSLGARGVPVGAHAAPPVLRRAPPAEAARPVAPVSSVSRRHPQSARLLGVTALDDDGLRVKASARRPLDRPCPARYAQARPSRSRSHALPPSLNASGAGG